MTDNLTPQQIQAAYMLARGCSTSDITYKFKISETTLYRWKRHLDFKELIDNILSYELAETRLRMAHLADASVSALWQMVANDRHDNTRLQAVLHALKLTGVTNIPSPNVTHGVKFLIKPGDEPDLPVIPEVQGESQAEELPGKEETMLELIEKLEELEELPEDHSSPQ